MRATRDDPFPASPRSRSSQIALCLLLLAGAVSLVWFVLPFYDGGADQSIYIVCARSLLAGEGYSYLGEPFTLRPPGFSLLLTLPLALDGDEIPLLNLYVSCFGLLCIGLLFLYARPRLSVPVAFAVAAAVWLNPVFQRLCNKVLSDVPGACAALVCLLFERWASKRPSAWRDLALGVLVAAAVYVRTLNLVLLPALLLARLYRARAARGMGAAHAGRFAPRAALLSAVVLMALLPWELRNAGVEPAGAAEQTLNHSYWVAMWHEDPGDPASAVIPTSEFVARTFRRGSQILTGLGSRLRHNTANLADGLLGLAALGLLGSALVRNRGAGEFFAAGVLLLLVVYFDFACRLLLPSALIVAVAAAGMLETALRRWCGPRLGPSLLVAAIALLTLHDFSPRADWPRIARLQREREAACSYVASEFPPEATLAAFRGWDYSVCLERPVYSLKFVVERQGIPGVTAFLKEHDVAAVLVRQQALASNRTLMAFLRSRYGVERQFGREHVVRVRPGASAE